MENGNFSVFFVEFEQTERVTELFILPPNAKLDEWTDDVRLIETKNFRWFVIFLSNFFRLFLIRKKSFYFGWNSGAFGVIWRVENFQEVTVWITRSESDSKCHPNLFKWEDSKTKLIALPSPPTIRSFVWHHINRMQMTFHLKVGVFDLRPHASERKWNQNLRPTHWLISSKVFVIRKYALRIVYPCQIR